MTAPSRYGLAEYGSSLYGGADGILTALYNPTVDWDKDGSNTSEYERVQEFTVRRGRDTLLYGRENYRYVDPGEFSITLDNYDNRYDPYNTASPLYPYIKPNRPFKLWSLGTDGIVYNIIAGFVRDIIPQQNERYVRISGFDGIDWLQSQNGPLTSLQTDYDVSEAITALITGASWPFADTSGWILGTSTLGINTYLGSSAVENNGDDIPYWWSDPDKSVWTSLTEVASAFAGDVFVRNDGTFAYNARSYGGTPKLYLTQDVIHHDIEQAQPWHEIRNDVRVTYFPRQATAANTELWRLNEVPSIAAGASLTLWARFQYQGETIPASSVTVPAATTDYTANDQADGGGASRTANISIVMTTYADRAKLVISNAHVGAVYLTLMKLRGTGLYAQSGSFTTSNDTASEAEYDKQSFSPSFIWLQETSEAQNHADYAIGLLSGVRRNVSVKLIQRPDLSLAADLFDVINIDLPALGINTVDYLLTNIEHNWHSGGPLITTWALEPTAQTASGFWLLGTSTLGETTRFAW